MTPEENERLNAISAALARMVRRQDELERRLLMLERAATGPGQAPSLESTAPPFEGTSPDLPAPERPYESTAPSLGAESPHGSGRLETALGLQWVSRAAVVTVVLALAFFFQYAFEKRWITETGRVLLGAAAGLAALGLGERFHRAGQSIYGQALTAAGVGFLYLSVWAAYGPYGLLPYVAAFALMAFTTAISGLLAIRYDSRTIAALGSAGGYLTPLLLQGRQETWFVLGYALLLSGGAAYIARRKRWPWLEGLALAGTAALYISEMPALAGERAVHSVFIVAAYALFTTAIWPPVAAAAQVLAPMTFSGLWAPQAAALWGALGFAVAGASVAQYRRAVQSGALRAASFAGFWAAWAIWQAQSPRPGAPSAGAALIASYALFLCVHAWNDKRGQSLPLADLIVAVLNPGFVFGAAYWWLGANSPWAGALAAGTALTQAGAARIMWSNESRGSRLAAGAAWALITLAVPVQFAGYRITVAWSLEAAALTWIGARVRRREAFIGAVALFALVALRLALADAGMYRAAAEYSALVNSRFLSFAAAAAGFWAAAKWVNGRRASLVGFLAGHAVMLWGLFLEAAGWAERVSAPENVLSVSTASISVLAGVYALALVAVGAIRRSAPSRMLGIGLICGVVLKLYLYDVWLLRAFYRMAAFAILGVLLWAMAYLYSRYRNSIESWWRSS